MPINIMGSLQENTGDPGELTRMELNSSNNSKFCKTSRRESTGKGWTSIKFASMWVSAFLILYVLSEAIPSTSALQGPPRGHHPHHHGPIPPPRHRSHRPIHSRGPRPHGPLPNARGPPRPHHRGVGGGGPPPPRPSRDAPHRLAPLKLNRPSSLKGGPPHDLHAAAQTLYDLRGFNIPLGGQQETQRFLRQHNNDPFSRPSGFTPANTNNGGPSHNSDPRTAPLVFPSFYQPHKPSTETTNKRPQTILNIFGHTQHLSQTKYEPAGQSDTSHGGQQQFRPSQVDLAYTNNVNNDFDGNRDRGAFGQSNSRHQNSPPGASAPSGPPSGPPPPHHPQQHKGDLGALQGRQVGPTPSQGTQILNYRAPEFQPQQQQQQQQHQRPPQPSQKPQQEDNEPFVYVYDDEDYEEGEDEFVDKPQNQINHNRVTPTPSVPRGTPPPTIRSGQSANNNRNNFNINHHQQPLHHPTQGPTPGFFRTTGPPPTAKAVVTSTSRPIPIHQNQNDFNNFNNNQFFHNGNQQQQQQSVRENPFFVNNHHQPQSPPPQQNNFGQDHHRLQTRPIVTTRPNVEIVPSSERKPPPDQSNAIAPALHNRPTQTPAPERFRRPIVQPNSPSPLQNVNHNTNQFFKQNTITPQQQNTFNQVVNLSDEDEDESEGSFYDQEPEVIQKLNPFKNKFQENPSRLRPVNTLVPKNRVPQEDIILPPNFPFHEQIDKTQAPKTFATSTGPAAPGRGDVLRFNSRPLTTSSEVPPTSQRTSSLRPQPIQTSQPALTSPPRTRNPTRGQTFQQTTSDAPPPPPSRVRSRPIRPNRPATTLTTTTTTTTTTPRPTFRPSPPFSSTTATSFDDGSDEYSEDDYNNSERVVDTVEQITQKQKSSIRPVFNNQIQDLQGRFPVVESPSITPQRPRARPTPAPEGITPFPTFRQSQRLGSNSNNRGREQTTLESPTVTIKTTTGKPLYYAGKMLSKEGGVYAGQNIPATHIYGSPVPSTAFNSVFEKVPESHEQPREQRPSRLNKNNKHQGQQQRVRGRGDENEGSPVIRGRGPVPTSTSSTPPSTNTRLVHPSRLRPQQVHVSTTPAQEVSDPPPRQPQRPAQSPKFLRPQSSSSTPESLDQSSQSPKRKKVIRPGQHQFRQQPTTSRTEASHQTSEVVPIVRETVPERESRPAPRQPQEDQDEQDQPKKVIRPHRIRPQQHSADDQPSSGPGAKLKTRRNRPRVQKPTQPPVETSSLIVEEIHPPRRVQQQQQQQQRDEESSPAPPPPKKLRPRLRPNNKQTPAPEALESVSVTQSSAKVSRKPTEAPGRFSSRFREDAVPVVLSTQATNADEEEDEPSRPPARPTFRPKAAKSSGGNGGLKPRRVRPQQKPRPQQNTEDEEDALPESIRLKPEDVLLNRKPARRIPPGSASDRLKALQERRNQKKSTISDFKKSNRNDEDEDEDTQDDNRKPSTGHRTIRRRKLATSNNNNKGRLRQQKQHQKPTKPSQYDEDEEDNPQNDQPDLPFQNKREITSKTSYKNSLPQQQDDENDEEVQNNEEEEYQEEEGDYESKDTGRPRQLHIPTNRGRTPQEVTSDEARSVLGIKRPTSTASSTTTRTTSTVISTSERVGSNAKRKSWDRAAAPAPAVTSDVQDEQDEEYEGQEDEEDCEGHHSHQKEVKVSTELPPKSTVSVRRSESTLVSTSETPVTTSRSIYSSTISSGAGKNLKPRKNKLSGKPGTSSTVVLSTSTSASTSVSSSTTDHPEEDEEDSPTTLPSTTASSLKARLRPNKKLLSSIQPRLSPVQQRENNETKRQSNLSKLLKLKTSSSTYSPISSSSTSSSSSSSSTSASNNKLFTMATEDPSLPLESIFPLKHKTS